MPDPPGGFRPWRQAWSEALYGERGFYRRDEGPAGHFETSANATGGETELLAAAVRTLARRHGCTAVVDVGAGRGELLRALAASDSGHPGDPAAPLQLLGVDVVPRPAGLPPAVRWLESPGGAALPAGLTGLTDTLVLAHEWLDVVPCDVLEVDDRGAPRLVEVDGSGRERLGALADEGQLAWCARWWPVAGSPPGSRVEVGRSRDEAWAALVGQVRSGVCVAVDYGHEVADRPAAGTLAAHRAGRAVPPVPDGRCDLTAHVALDAVREAGASPATAGRSSLGSQRDMLRELGVDPGRPAPTGDTAAYLRGLRRAAAASTLLDPGGLGGFGWLVHEVATGQARTGPARVEP